MHRASTRACAAILIRSRARRLAVPRVASLAMRRSAGWWSLPFWLVDVLHPAVLPRPAARDPAEPSAWCCRPADGRVVVVGKARDPYLEARRAEDQRVHERVQRALATARRWTARAKERGITPGLFVTRRSTRPRSTTSATRCGCRLDDGADVTCVQVAGPDRAAHPLLREGGRPARARPALRLHPLRLARGRLPAAGRRRRRSAIGDKV